MLKRNTFPANLFLFLSLIFSINLHAQNPVFEWTRQAGGKSNERGTAIEQDSFGNVYCTGEVSDSTRFADTSFVANFADIFLSKFSSGGTLQWIKLCGGTGLDRGLDMKVDHNGDLILTGFFSNTALFGDSNLTSAGSHDVFIAKYNTQGDFLWVVHGAGSDQDEGLCLAVDENNNIYVGGFFESTLHLGSFTLSAGSFSSAFMAKVAPDGTVLWAKQSVMKDYGESYTNDVVCDNNGNIVFTGNFDDTMVLQDTTLYSYDGNADVFVAKYNATGDLLWVLQAGGNYDDKGNAVAIDELNNIYLAGDFIHTASFGNINLTSADNNADVFIAKLDSSGSFQWIKQGSGAGFDSPNSIFYNQGNGIAVCGGYTADFTIGDSTFNSYANEEVFMATYTPSGVFDKALSIGGNGDDAAFDVYLNDDNYAYLIGKFQNMILFGDISLISYDLADIFISKINVNKLTDINFVTPTPVPFSLSQNYPNPFYSQTTIKFTIPKEGKVELTVYDIQGKKIKTLINKKLNNGDHKIFWNGENTYCKKVAPGIYFIRLKYNHQTITQSMAFLR